MNQIVYNPFISESNSPSAPDIPEIQNPFSNITIEGDILKDSYKPQYNLNPSSESQLPLDNIGSEQPTTPQSPAQPSNVLDGLTDLLTQEGFKFRVTSGNRPGAKTKQGKQSFHATNQARDIVPLDGDFNKFKRQLASNPKILKYMRDNKLGILDETSQDMLKRTGGTGAHWHIGPDQSALAGFKAMFGKLGGKLLISDVIF